jgi:hypothetical protein
MLLWASALGAQTLSGVVVDQTGLPLPGVSVQLVDGARIITLVTTGGDGRFQIDAVPPFATVIATLDGFETARVAAADAARIELSIARASETTTVVAPALPSSSPTASTVGTTLTATTVARLPSTHLKARDSLPLLPSMVRGADGLMRLGGSRPYETPLLLDGFNVTDPATGSSSLNLPFEAVEGIEVLRDPAAVSAGGLIGGLVQMVTRPGGDAVHFGVQGFIPRPRLQNPGFGRLEAIFPRAYVSGPAFGRRLHYLGAVEYDFERIVVPEVTTGTGPVIREQSATMFGRVDVQAGPRYNLTFHGIVFPSSTGNLFLSPRHQESATADLHQRDLFAGVTNRIALDDRNVLSIGVDVLSHDTTLAPNGAGAAILSNLGWRADWFSYVERHSTRVSVAAAWDRLVSLGKREHAITVGARLASQHLGGTVVEHPVLVEDARGRVVRRVTFGRSAGLAARDRPVGLFGRDVWSVGDRTQVDLGFRLDHDGMYGGATPSARVGLRQVLDASGATVVRASYGRFVGGIPLAVQAFTGYPIRIDSTVDPETGLDVERTELRPAVEGLVFPRATAATVQVERQLLPGLDVQVGVTSRRSTRLATLDVPVVSGPVTVRSMGTGSYRELQISARRQWARDQQLFVSYVRSSARGELNDFGALFQSLDAPLLQPGGQARLPADAPHRWVAWGTFGLRHRIVVSPVVEWHSGFPYSVVDERYRYFGPPNTASFPAFFSTDLIVYKTFTVRRRSADLGIQLFNATNHTNPRDVYPVINAPHFGRFTNSIGAVLRGFMMLKW